MSDNNSKPAIEQADIYPSGTAPDAAKFNVGVAVGKEPIAQGVREATRAQNDQNQHRYEGK
jgi:hypothetical protein